MESYEGENISSKLSNNTLWLCLKWGHSHNKLNIPIDAKWLKGRARKQYPEMLEERNIKLNPDKRAAY